MKTRDSNARWSTKSDGAARKRDADVSLVVRRLRRWLAFRPPVARWISCWNEIATRPLLLLFSFLFFFTVLSLPFLFSSFYVLWIGPYKCGAILQAARTIYMFTIARRDERRNYNIPPLERMVADNIDPDGPFLSNVYTSNILENTWGYPGLLKNGLLGLNLCHEERDKLI